MDLHLIRSASLSGYVEVASSFGLDPRAMMRNVGLPWRCLDDPETLISVSAVCRLLERSAVAAKAEDFGLRMAYSRRLSNLGPVSLVLRQQPTGLQALQTLFRYLRLLNGSLLADLEESPGIVVIREHLVLGTPVATHQLMELAIGVIYQILRDLLGASWRPRRVCFAHRPPKDMRFHRAFLGAVVEFNAGFNGVVCASLDLERKLLPAEHGLAGFAQRFLDDALGRKSSASAETVRQMIASLLGSGRCTIEKVAQNLGVSRRTVHRQLVAENTSFSALLDAVRREFVLRLLNDGDQSLAEVAEMLGFSSASAFAHWFRSAFGGGFIQQRRVIRQQPEALNQAKRAGFACPQLPRRRLYGPTGNRSRYLYLALCPASRPAWRICLASPYRSDDAELLGR